MTALSMQGREQAGKMEMFCAEATAAIAAAMTAEYFILEMMCWLDLERLDVWA